MADYLPSSDSDLRLWVSNFVSNLNSLGPTVFGLTTQNVTDLSSLGDNFADGMADNEIGQAHAQSARAEKDARRQVLEDTVRGLVARIQAHPGVTDVQRTALGLTVRSSTRTPVTAPGTKPVATVDTSQRLQHKINFVDELTPTSRAKPDGVAGCEIWVKVDGPPPAGDNELTYVATDSKTPYLTVYDGSDGGKVAHYMLRWVSTRGDAGPWSQTVSATITK